MAKHSWRNGPVVVTFNEQKGQHEWRRFDVCRNCDVQRNWYSDDSAEKIHRIGWSFGKHTDRTHRLVIYEPDCLTEKDLTGID